MKIIERLFCTLKGTQIYTYELSNNKNTQITITNVGGTIMSILAPDKWGKVGEISLGFNDPTFYLNEKYRNDLPYLGAIIGRFANRIENSKFILNNVEYKLEANNGNNHLHGGSYSFDSKIWNSKIIKTPHDEAVQLTYMSPHMENGYPGNLNITVTYSLTDKNELIIEYIATTDAPTHINLTNHTYFNLKGPGNSILNHKVFMNAREYTPKNDQGIPLGRIDSVIGTPLDFTTFKTIGDRIEFTADGYDHNYVIDGKAGELRTAAYIEEETTGRLLGFSTTEPGFQFYTGYNLSGNHSRNEKSFSKYTGICLEAQHYPNSPNEPSFPTTLLNPGQTYKQTTVYKFGTIA